MKLQIDNKPVAQCVVNMKGFLRWFKSTWDIREAVENNTIVIDAGVYDKKMLIDSVYLYMDWGRIIPLLKDSLKDMEVKFFKCVYTGKLELTPDTVTEDGREFTFSEERKNGIDIILINSYICSTDFDLRCYLNNTTFNYALRDRWKPLFKLE